MIVAKFKSWRLKMRHDELLKKRGELVVEFQKEAADLDARIRLLQADEDYRKFLRAKAVAKEIAEIETERREGAVAHGGRLRTLDRETESAAEPAITQFVRWCLSEKVRTLKEISARGIIERDRLGNEAGFIVTNEKKINARREAIELAIKRAQALQFAPQEDIAAEIEKLQNSIPRLDTESETIPVAAGFADALR